MRKKREEKGERVRMLGQREGIRIQVNVSF